MLSKTVREHSGKGREPDKRERPRFWNSLRFRFGASYLLIMAAVLLILNTYPLLVSENMVFRSKETSMLSSVSMMVSSLSGLDRLTEENVAG
ncbi:MAG: hypothetical protein IJT94_04385, partial [Oscillibacter sp.]|nr:hypothetical protein [Oscillibacter sp.]